MMIIVAMAVTTTAIRVLVGSRRISVIASLEKSKYYHLPGLCEKVRGHIQRVFLFYHIGPLYVNICQHFSI